VVRDCTALILAIYPLLLQSENLRNSRGGLKTRFPKKLDLEGLKNPFSRFFSEIQGRVNKEGVLNDKDQCCTFIILTIAASIWCLLCILIAGMLGPPNEFTLKYAYFFCLFFLLTFVSLDLLTFFAYFFCLFFLLTFVSLDLLFLGLKFQYEFFPCSGLVSDVHWRVLHHRICNTGYRQIHRTFALHSKQFMENSLDKPAFRAFLSLSHGSCIAFQSLADSLLGFIGNIFGVIPTACSFTWILFISSLIRATSKV